jgi:hypothetical protein
LPRSGHGISVDIDRDLVNRLVAAWFDRFSRGAVAAPPPQASGLAASPSSI